MLKFVEEMGKKQKRKRAKRAIAEL